MIIKYIMLDNPEGTDWKTFDTVKVLKLTPFIFKPMTQEKFDAMELSRFQKYRDRGRLEFEIIEK